MPDELGFHYSTKYRDINPGSGVEGAEKAVTMLGAGD